MRGLLVHAEAPEARDLYLHLMPEFEQSPTDTLHLVLLMKDIRRASDIVRKALRRSLKAG